MNLNSERLDVVGAIGASGKVRQVELNLIPAIVESHGHGANEGLDTSGTLIVARSESSSHIFVVQDLDFECEIFLQVFDDHHQKGQLDAERFLRIGRTCDVRSADVGAYDFEN